MCLEYQLPKNKAKEILNSIPPEGLKVYKVVGMENGRYKPLHRGEFGPYKEGVNKAKRKRITSWDGKKYRAGFHLFMNKEDAKSTFDSNKTIECIVKKSWITTIGAELKFDDNCRRTDSTVIVAKKAIFPIFEEK